MKRIIAASVVLTGVMVVLGLFGPGIYRSAVVAYHYRQIFNKPYSPDEHYVAISKYPNEAYELAQRKLRSSQEWPQVSIGILGDIGDDRSIALISSTLERGIRPFDCANNLRKIGTQQARDALSRALHHRNAEVRRVAYPAYIRIVAQDTDTAVNACRDGLRDESIAVRLQVLHRLKELPEVREPLKGILIGIFESESQGRLAEVVTETLARDCYPPAVDAIMSVVEKRLLEGFPRGARDHLRFLGEGCGNSLIPRLLKLARKCPQENVWPIVETISDMAGRGYGHGADFESLTEAEVWWSQSSGTEK